MTDLTTPGLSLKAWPFFGYAPGNYMGNCLKCSTVKSGLAKRAISCLECAVISAKQFIDEQNDEPAVLPTLANEGVVEDFLHELDGWESAYPLSAFPEPDFKLAAALLKAGGISLGAVSASNMRHVVSQIAPKARSALASVRHGVGDGELVEDMRELLRHGTKRGLSVRECECALDALLARLTEGGSR